MSAIKGYTDRKHEKKYKAGDQQYSTVQVMHDDRVGIDVIQRAVFDVETITASGINDNVVTLVGTSAIVGDLLQHVNSGLEFIITDVNGDDVSCSRPIPASFDTEDFDLKRYVTFKTDKDGSTVVSVGTAPLMFIKDSVDTTVTEDTVDPTNNDPLPNKLFFQKDGTTIPANKDTATPSNTAGIPVEIVGADGSVINITAGDINVQTSHLGANFDSMRIGDGTNLMAISGDLEAQTHDPKVLAAFTAGQLARAGSLGVTLSTEDQATQDAILTAFTAGQAARAASLGVTLSTEDQATQEAILAAFSEGQKASADSAPVVLSTEQEAILQQIADANEPESSLASVYVNAATTNITVAGVTIGAIASAGRSLFVQNNANAIAVEVNGVQVGVSLPGQHLNLKVSMAVGNIVLKSLTGADITAGDVSVDILG